jgi:maltose/moltooligosaccharide transporter
MGFAMQSFFYGLALTCIKTTVNFTYYGVQNTALLGIIPDSIPLPWWNVFIVTVLWTVITLKNTPEELEAFENTKKPLS